MRLLFLLTAIITPSLSFALFCPNNFNLINLGDSLDKVTQTCGKPAKEESKDVDKEVPQEWTYYIPQTVATGTSYQGQGTLKTTVSFDKDGNAINISVNGVGVGASTICGQNITLGQSRDAIKSACGAPSMIAKQEPTDSSGKVEKNKVVTYTYTSTPPVVMVFENGVLKSYTNQ